MRVLVFQHIAIEHPGLLRDFLAADGSTMVAVELDVGEPVPPLDGFDALWVMGGPMDVWEEDKHPWLGPEKTAIREAVRERAMPFLGVCLGHQLLADALGGRVVPMATPEVGILDVELTQIGRHDSLFTGLDPILPSLQWHGAEVVELPPGAQVLASSSIAPVQAFRVGERAYGLQFHVELTQATVAEWGAVPAYAASLERTLGPGALHRLEEQAAARMKDFNRVARRLYDNFKQILTDP